MAERIKKKTDKSGELSPELKRLLEEEAQEAEVNAVIDAAREIGIKDYSREDAIKGLLQEIEHRSEKND